VSDLNRVQKTVAKFASNVNESVWETFDTVKIVSPNMRRFQGIHRQTGLESDRK
jgi:hypothetical protein